jgi:hypothetical protein
MPVEGAIPHIAGIDMYGNSIPAGTVGGDLFEYIALEANSMAEKKSYFRGKSTLVIKPDEPNAAQH